MEPRSQPRVGAVEQSEVRPTSSRERQEGVPRAVVRRQNYLIEFGAYSLEVDPTDGGRVVGFGLGGRSVVMPRSESLDAYGSSFWPSPQSDWQWPPPHEMDKAAWEVSIDDDRLVLESEINQQLGLSAKQLIEVDIPREVVVIEHVLNNHGPGPRKVAPWQNTRVRPRGLSFFPSDSPSLPPSTLELKPTNGVIWFQHDPTEMKKSRKLFADGREGWLAHVDGDLLFVKLFPDIPREQQAPGEAEIEIYVHEDGSFVEVEQQGAYVEIQPGGSSVWEVRWLVRRLPRELEAEVGNVALVEHVRSLVAKAGLKLKR